MFVTTLVFAKLVTWMRGQSGTSDLRALAYMDEVAGYVPPTAAPPAKKPILTILKQGRAFGLGLVLSTQNPVDLDYKAMSNAGTWLVGRLQTENDKARVLEGLRSAAGGADISALDAVDRRAPEAPVHARLGEGSTATRVLDALGDVVPARAADEGAGAAADEHAPRPGARRARWPRRRRAGARPAAPLAADETSVAPAAATGVTVSYLDPAAPWASAGRRDGRGDAPARLPRHARSLRYDDTAAGIDEQQEFEALYGPLDGGLDLDAETVVDFDDRDFRPDAPAGAAYVLPAASDRRGEVLRAGRQGRAGAARREPCARGLPQQAAEAHVPPRRDAGGVSRSVATRPARSKADAETVKLTKRLEAKKDRLRERARARRSVASRSSTRRRSRGRRTS